MFDISTLPFGLTVTAIGILIVFFGLVVLIGLIKIMQVATSGMGKKEKKEKKAAPAAAPAPAAPAAQDEELMAVLAAAVAAQDDELIAVISAVVAVMMEEEDKSFRVRRIRRISNASAWNKAGREEQIYSRF